MGMMHGVVVEDLVVDLVRHHDQAVPAGQVGDGLQVACGYTAPVGLLGLITTIALVRAVILASRSSRSGCQPVLSSQQVVHGAPAGQAGRGRPQRVVGSGQQHLVAVVQHRLQRHGDQLADPVAEPDVVDVAW